MRHLDDLTLNLYAELSELLSIQEASRTFANLDGTFTTKVLAGGRRYVYFQHMLPGSQRRQVYVGPESDITTQIIRDYKKARPEAENTAQAVSQLARQLRAAGAPAVGPAAFRVISHLGASGLFRQGAVLIGTNAILALAPYLGVSWSAREAMRTNDIDFAATDSVPLAIPGAPIIDLPEDLAALQMGFLPVPGLSHKTPSTSFHVRGKTLRVDLLTPASPGSQAHSAMSVPRWNTFAERLDYLDYLVGSPILAPILGRAGAVLAWLPDPARMAVHKLIIHTQRDRRMSAGKAKARKDLLQAAMLITVLTEVDPDALSVAWQDLDAHPAPYRQHAEEGLAAAQAAGFILDWRPGADPSAPSPA